MATNDSSPAIKLQDVSFSYSNAAPEVLKHITCEIASGSYVCLVGNNGSGKSSLLQLMAAMLAPSSGSLTLFGEKIATSGTLDEAARIRVAPRIGYMFQDPENQLLTSIVEDEVAFGLENLGARPTHIRARVDAELARVSLLAYARKNPEELSGGQRQRVALAATLAPEPDLILLDEPAAALDAHGRKTLHDTILELKAQGKTIVHITHHTDELTYADRIIMLNEGAIAFSGTLSEYLNVLYSQMQEQTFLQLPFAARVACRVSRLLGDKNQAADLQSILTEDDLRSWFAHNKKKDVYFQQQHLEQPEPSKEDLSPLIDIKHVSFTYDQEPTLTDINLSVAQGEHIAVIGATGSGKSTLIKLLAGLYSPDSGSAQILDASAQSYLGTGKVGYVMQAPERQLFAPTTIADVMQGLINLGADQKTARDQAMVALNIVGLCDLADASPFSVSGGQARRIAIAGTLAMDPTVLLLDEPAQGLDVYAKHELYQLLDALDITRIEITHDMDRAATADRVLVMEEGYIAALATPDLIFGEKYASLLARIGQALPDATRMAYELGFVDAYTLVSEDELAQLIAKAVRGDAHVS